MKLRLALHFRPTCISFLCALAVLQFACVQPELRDQSTEYREGYAIGAQEAALEIAADTPTIYAFGLISGRFTEGEMQNAEGIPYQAIAGCVVDDGILGRADGHNHAYHLAIIF